MTSVARSPDVLWRIVQDRVLTRQVNGAAFDLLGTVSLVWIALDSPAGPSEIVRRISEAVADVTPAMIASAIDHLRTLGLIIEAM